MPIRNCLYCNKLFDAPQRDITRGNGKYCSRKCSGNYKSSLPSKAPIIELTCAYCNSTFTKPSRYVRKANSRSGLRFCNRKCKELGQRLDGGNIKAIQPSHFGTGTGEHHYRAKALNAFPNKCNRCGYDELIGILVVHHKDRNRSNSHLSNLEILCPNCHAKEHYINHDGSYSSKRK